MQKTCWRQIVGAFQKKDWRQIRFWGIIARIFCINLEKLGNPWSSSSTATIGSWDIFRLPNLSLKHIQFSANSERFLYFYFFELLFFSCLSKFELLYRCRSRPFESQPKRLSWVRSKLIHSFSFLLYFQNFHLFKYYF